jgi:predicted nucleotidyltransferase
MLTKEQLEDLAQLQTVAEHLGAEVAIIGAAALHCFVDLDRFTMDVDLAVALDLEDFAVFSVELRERGWTREARREHRWRGPNGSLIDLMPAGPNLRAARRIVWPESQFEMSLVGFEHVFTQSLLFSFAKDIQIKVAPPPVIALLKIVAYTEDQHRRLKDLMDLKWLFRHYEASSNRIFGDDVFAAELEDIDYANAFLLGSDVGAIATDEDAGVVNAFLRKLRISADESADFDRDLEQTDALRFQMQLGAFDKGFISGRSKTL